jgi:hypothetical protein
MKHISVRNKSADELLYIRRTGRIREKSENKLDASLTVVVLKSKIIVVLAYVYNK